MKGLEQRHSQLPNAWTRPQGLHTRAHTHKHAPHLRIHGEWAVEGKAGNCVCVCACVGGCAYVHDGERRFIKLLSLLTNLCNSSQKGLGCTTSRLRCCFSLWNPGFLQRPTWLPCTTSPGSPACYAVVIRKPEARCQWNTDTSNMSMQTKPHLRWDASDSRGEAPEVRQGDRTAAVSQMVGETLWSSGWRTQRHKKGWVKVGRQWRGWTSIYHWGKHRNSRSHAHERYTERQTLLKKTKKFL